MHFHTNHMYCTRPCWGGEEYWCRFLVSIDRIVKGNTYYDPPAEDWTNLTEKFSVFDEEDYNRTIAFYKEKGYEINETHQKAFATKRAYKLKPEVIQWLNDNVKDRPDKEQPKGWCCGDDVYLATNSLQISIFFYRRSDAMSFIKHWSVYKKPTTYFDYFCDIRKALNTDTNKLVNVEKF